MIRLLKQEHNKAEIIKGKYHDLNNNKIPGKRTEGTRKNCATEMAADYPACRSGL